MSTPITQTPQQTEIDHDTICMKCDVWIENDNSLLFPCQKCPRVIHPQCMRSRIDIKDGFVCSDMGKNWKCESRKPVISKIIPPVIYNENEKRYECKRLKINQNTYFLN